jgi:hypothetical protein
MQIQCVYSGVERRAGLPVNSRLTTINQAFFCNAPLSRPYKKTLMGPLKFESDSLSTSTEKVNTRPYKRFD